MRAVSLISAAVLGSVLWGDTLACQSGVVRGTVMAEAGERRLANAEVQITDLKLATRTDSAGNFVLTGVPAGAHAIVVRAPGYTAYSADFTLKAGATFDADYLLALTSTTLAKVDVRDVKKPYAIKLEEFEERRVHGLGHYITADQFEKQDGKPLSSFIKQYVPGINIIVSGSKKWIASGRAGGTCGKVFQSCGLNQNDPLNRNNPMNFDKVPAACYARVVVNDRIVFNGDPAKQTLVDIDAIQSQEIIGLEYYTGASAPSKYAGTTDGACGTLIIWTKY